ncbi:hypothetical protein GCM10022297_12940 [Lactobacillus hamsteri]|uniref:Uncharacterized protein n=1 Tax=Lactobacillus hamsteri DSM 5661 = JCM 6256 TaxID=1423754 RepID=A0A0R1YKV9_9LACO|nr:hypothetical protein [Lactobacillus hamsteri]KRM40587.1 hypothetical protein FC39_GL000402 [Lactobacillus hamsteri DSM 5661 = JCM 6256]
MSFFNFITNILNKTQTHNHQDIDALLTFPYLQKKAIRKNIIDEQCNIERKYAIKHYMNKYRHDNSRHEALAPFYENNKLVNWIGIVSDIIIDNKENPRILIDKLTLDNPKKPQLLDYHLWIRTNKIKYIQNDSNTQTIAIGDAIRGISSVDTYLGNQNEVKYGFNATVIRGAGILIGNKRTNAIQTNLNAKIKTNYDRKNDWILKCTNSCEAIAKYSKSNANEILSQPSQVSISFQKSNYSHYYSHLSKEDEVTSTKKENQTVISNGKYIGTVNAITYISRKNNNLTPIIRLSNITNENGQNIITKSYFKYEGKILELGQLVKSDKIIFSTKTKLSNKVTDLGTIEDCTLKNKQNGGLPIPSTKEELLGYIMAEKDDTKPNHLYYRQKYQDWLISNKLEASNNLISKDGIQQILQIKKSVLNQRMQKSFIIPKQRKNNKDFYDFSVIQKIAEEKEPIAEATDSLKTLTGQNLNTITTYDGIYYTRNFANLDSYLIRNEIERLSRVCANLYIKAKDENGNEKYVLVKTITQAKSYNDEKMLMIDN